jgi:PAS domain-containing protein
VIAEPLPDMATVDMLVALGRHGPRRTRVPAVLVTAQVEAASAVQAIRAGTHDYLPIRDLDAHRLSHAIRNAMHTLALHREIAAHRHELDRQREWLSVTLASVGDGVITTDVDGRIETINPTAVQMTGSSGSQALHRRVSEVVRLIDPQTRSPRGDPVGEVLAAAHPGSVAADWPAAGAGPAGIGGTSTAPTPSAIRATDSSGGPGDP